MVKMKEKMGVLLTLILLSSGCVNTMNASLPDAVSLNFGDKKIVVSAPKGFCVDQRLTRKSASATTLIIIDCIKVNNSNIIMSRRRPISAILTATVVDFESSEIKDISKLKELLTRKPGINYLSKAHTNTLLKVHQAEIKKDLLLFLIEQRGSDIGVKQSNYFWRVFFIIDGRIVSMTGSNFSESSNSIRKLEKLISEFAKNTIAANIKED